MSKRFRKFGYTLAEVVTVMLVIAVIVGISIKVSKAKFNNLLSYTYYSAYQTLNVATRQMLFDFKPYITSNECSIY